jgi:hypothetical protein
LIIPVPIKGGKMTKISNVTRQSKEPITDIPLLNVTKVGIISRNYSYVYDNGHRDFSYSMPDVLKFLDNKECDTAIFSLFSINCRNEFSVLDVLKKLGLKHIKTVLLEEFKDGTQRQGVDFGFGFVVFYLTAQGWKEYRLKQKFGTLKGMKKGEINDFVKEEMPNRFLGNFCVLLCGEINGVKYSKKDKKVNDNFGLRESIPNKVKIILNPTHDRMIRHEMPCKKKFLSENGRWVISVWNKGKVYKDGKVRKELNPAWSVFYDGKEKAVDLIQNKFGVEIGILDATIPTH